MTHKTPWELPPNFDIWPKFYRQLYLDAMIILGEGEPLPVSMFISLNNAGIDAAALAAKFDL